MRDVKTLTAADFTNSECYDTYGFISDINISNDECSERIAQLYEHAKQLDFALLEAFKNLAEPFMMKRDFLSQWTFGSNIELLDDSTFHKLMELDELERCTVLSVLREQAAKLKCKTEFNKKLKAVEKRVISSNTATIQPPEYPFIYASGMNFATGEYKYSVNTALLAEYVRKNCIYRFARDTANGMIMRYWYDNKKGVYRLVSDNDIKGFIDTLIQGFDPALVNSKYSREAFELICHDDNYITIEQTETDENIINFENGLLYLDTLELKPHTPEVFSKNQIPCRWNTGAAAPVNFDNYLNDLTRYDRDIQQILLEYMGLIISNVSSRHFKKALITYGPGNTGKSQLKLLTEMIIGNNNTIAIDLEALERRFGTSAIYGKRLAGAADMSFVEINELKTFKQITGGDNIMIEYKGAGAFNAYYNGFLWFCTNELPRFGGDKGDHVYNRMILIECSNIIPEKKQDRDLLHKMYAECEGIVLQAVLAARQVVTNGYKLDIPAKAIENAEQYKIDNSPIAQFYYECCHTAYQSKQLNQGCDSMKF